MQATVVGISREGQISLRVRRGYRLETLSTRRTDLHLLQVIEVKRQVNNPYLVFVSKVERRHYL